ncbi:MAG: peptide chain release factor 1 [Bacillota bacterium]|nr:peptide chain release factor 1 [Bacillota bacterium]
MLEKLDQIEARYSVLENTLSDGSIFQNPAAASKLLKEQKELKPVVDTYRLYKAADCAEKDAGELSSSDPDPEIRELAREELYKSKEQKEELLKKLRVLLLPKDLNDDKNVIIEIRSGVGGEEAALFASELYRMYSMYAETHNFKSEIMNLNETELGGIKEISFMVEGAGAYSRLKFESGTHRVQRVPETESQGRIHTSAVTVAVLPEAEEVEVDINPSDLEIDTFRSSGAGGQHVNKTESAIRITHVPTGVVVECQDERSQYKNRDRAMKILRSKLYELRQNEIDSERAADRKSQVGSGDRSERIRTYNFPQGRVTDHRIGLTLYRLDAFMNGDLDEMINALINADQAEKLRVIPEA